MSINEFRTDKPQGVTAAEEDGFTCVEGTSEDSICDSLAASYAEGICGDDSNITYGSPDCDFRSFGSSDWYCAKLINKEDFERSVKCKKTGPKPCPYTPERHPYPLDPYDPHIPEPEPKWPKDREPNEQKNRPENGGGTKAMKDDEPEPPPMPDLPPEPVSNLKAKEVILRSKSPDGSTIGPTPPGHENDPPPEPPPEPTEAQREADSHLP